MPDRKNDTVYLIDYLGNHCGMHYYDAAFREVLSAVGSVQILSNFSDGGAPAFFADHYRGGIFAKACSLLKNIRQMSRFVRNHPNDVLIYLHYGNLIDLPFLWCLGRHGMAAVDIHEAVAQASDGKTWLKKALAFVFRHRIGSVIVHSQRTDDFLDTFGFAGRRFHVPHFRYSFARELDESRLGREVLKAATSSKKKVLFFGNLNESKGVDLLMAAFNALPVQQAADLSVIIAGKDNDGSVHRVNPKDDREWHFLVRHIDDDELIYLYKNADYVALPYRKTSQSGILEMAFYFRKPVLLSNLPYFRKTLDEFPSFGLVGDDFTSLLASLSDDTRTYFCSEDVAKYENRKEVRLFMEDFAQWMERK